MYDFIQVIIVFMILSLPGLFISDIISSIVNTFKGPPKEYEIKIYEKEQEN